MQFDMAKTAHDRQTAPLTAGKGGLFNTRCGFPVRRTVLSKRARNKTMALSARIITTGWDIE